MRKTSALYDFLFAWEFEKGDNVKKTLEFRIKTAKEDLIEEDILSVLLFFIQCAVDQRDNGVCDPEHLSLVIDAIPSSVNKNKFLANMVISDYSIDSFLQPEALSIIKFIDDPKVLEKIRAELSRREKLVNIGR